MDPHETNPSIDKFSVVEIEKLFDAQLSTQAQRITLATFIGTVSLGTFSTAFYTQKSVLFFIASALLVIFMVIDMVGYSALLRLYFRSLEVQNQLRKYEPHTFLSILLLGRIEEQIRNILSIEDPKRQLMALRALPIKHPSPFGFWLPLLAMIVEIAAGLTTWLIFDWSFF